MEDRVDKNEIYNRQFLCKKRMRQSNNNEEQEQSLVLPTVLVKDLDSYEVKGWRSCPNSQISDYFNYGFNEETWKNYQKILQERYVKLKNYTGTNEIVIPENKKVDKILFNHLPCEFGGLDDIFDEVKYKKLNLYDYKYNIKKNYIPILSLNNKKEVFLNLNRRKGEDTTADSNSNDSSE